MKTGTMILLVFAFFVTATSSFAQNAKVQIVHNSPYYELDTVIVYINDEVAVSRLAYNNATAFIDIPAGDVKVDIVAKDAEDNSEPLFTKTVTLEADVRYVVFAAGNPLDTETDNTYPFDLYGVEGVAETVETAGEAQFLIFHGSPDAPPVTIGVRDVGVIQDSLHFGDFTDYFSVAANDAVVELKVQATGFNIASYDAPFGSLADEVFVVYARGIYNNANKFDSFGLSAVFADGTVVDLEKTAEPNYPYPVDPETELLGSVIFFQDGYNLALRNEDVTNVLAYADMPGNKVLRLTPADYGARGFYYDEGINMQANIDRVDTLYMRIRVFPDDKPMLAIMMADMLDNNPSQSERDYGFQVNWPIPDTMYNGKWYDLAIPLPLATKAEHDTAVARGELDPIRARWRFVDAWSGSYNIGPSDPLWRDITWYNMRFFGLTHSASGSATAEFDYIYLGKMNDFDFEAATSVPTSAVPQLSVAVNATNDTLIVTWNHDVNSDIAGYELYYSGDNIATYADAGQNRAGVFAGAETFTFRLPFAGIDPNNLELTYNFMLYPSNQYSFIPPTAVPSKASVTVTGKASPYIYGLTAEQEDAIIANFDAGTAGPDGFRADVFFPLDLKLDNDANNDLYYGPDDASGKVWVAYRNNTTEDYTTFYLYAEVKDDAMSEIATWDPENKAGGEGTWIHDIDATKKDGSLPWNVYGDEQLMMFFGTYAVNPATGATGLRKRGENPDYFISYMPFVSSKDKRNGGVPDGLVSRLWLEKAGTENNGVGDTTYYYNSNHQFVYNTIFEMMYDDSGNYIGWKILAAIDAEDLIADESQTDTKFVAPADDATMVIPFALNLVDRDPGSPWWGSGHELWYNTKGYRPLEVQSSVSGIGAVAVLGKDVVVTSNENSSQLETLSFKLNQNYPNPFNPTTTIEFTIPKANNVTLSVYNVLGQKVATLMNNQMLNAGVHKVSFDARNLASGVYFYRIQAGSFVSSKKMMLIK